MINPLHARPHKLEPLGFDTFGPRMLDSAVNVRLTRYPGVPRWESVIRFKA